MVHQLRHRSASGGTLHNLWELDEDGKILASIRVASGPLVHVTIAVANPRTRARHRGEFALVSVSSSGECWAVEHGCYDAHLDPPHPLLPPMSLLLTNAPPEVAERLQAIALK